MVEHCSCNIKCNESFTLHIKSSTIKEYTFQWYIFFVYGHFANETYKEDSFWLCSISYVYHLFIIVHTWKRGRKRWELRSCDTNPTIVWEEAHDSPTMGFVHSAGEPNFHRNALLSLKVVLHRTNCTLFQCRRYKSSFS